MGRFLRGPHVTASNHSSLGESCCSAQRRAATRGTVRLGGVFSCSDTARMSAQHRVGDRVRVRDLNSVYRDRTGIVRRIIEPEAGQVGNQE